MKFVYLERTLERVPFEQVGLSHPLGASAPFIGTEAAGLERQPRGYLPLRPFRRGSRMMPLAPLRKSFIKPPKSL